MGLKKKRDAYFITYNNGVKVCVSEDLYRAWVYYVNKEYHSSKQYSPSLVHKNGESIVLPSRLVSFEDFMLENAWAQFKYCPTVTLDVNTVTDVLLNCINELPIKQSRAILLIYFEGLSESNTAKLMHVAQSSVNNYKHAALARLKQLLTEKGYSKEDLFSMLHK